MDKFRVLLTSDIHCTDLEDWYGVRDEERMQRWLEDVLRHKGINAQVDYWGYDVDHDWPWWYKMVAHYAPRFLY